MELQLREKRRLAMAAHRMLELGGEPQRALAWLLPAWESLQARGGLDNQHAQRRLLRSLLGAWRARYSEPMADFVASMASFVSRDNPVLDGPRTSR